jgi:hypothetical protein
MLSKNHSYPRNSWTIQELITMINIDIAFRFVFDKIKLIRDSEL